MRAVVQRVTKAHVEVSGETVGHIDRGLVVLLGVEHGDHESTCVYMAEKLSGLRIFSDEQGKMNLSVADIDGEILLVSQFTLLGDARKGRRPNFSAAAAPDIAEKLYMQIAAELRSRGIPVETGRFGADMSVHLINDGPVTLMLDSNKKF